MTVEVEGELAAVEVGDDGVFEFVGDGLGGAVLEDELGELRDDAAEVCLNHLQSAGDEIAVAVG